jgi:diacylglycerol kinase family enzyme
MNIRIVLNRDGGTLKTADPEAIGHKLSAALTAKGHTASLDTPPGKHVKNTLETAANDSQVDCIIVGGGDGSVSLAASLCWEHKKVLGVLPAGTMNFFARSLQMPLDLDAAIEALAEASVRPVDIGTVNGRVFVHQVSLGIQPRMVELRKSIPYTSRLGKMAASARAALKTLTSPPSFRIKLTDGREDHSGHYSALAVSNNAYGDGHLPYADTLDDGVLGIYSAPRLTFWMNLKLARDMLLGRWTDNEHLLSQSTDWVNIEMLSKVGGRKMSVDGELAQLEKRLEIKLHRLALKVLSPQTETRP